MDLLKEATIKDGQLSLKAEKEAYSAGMLAALGSSSVPFQNYVLTQLIKLLPDNQQGDFTDELNSILAMLKAIAPQNELEAMMAAQMIASHVLTMDSMRRVRFADLLPQYQAHGNLANKFARTFAFQRDALGKHRRGGEQVVRHVHVNDGGQAVIAGTVVTGGGVVK